jgi:hypothetical protein
LVLVTPDSRCAVVYTGLATILERDGWSLVPLEEWLASEISQLPAGTALPGVVHHLASRLDEAVRTSTKRLAGGTGLRNTTILLVGFEQGAQQPTVVCISNHVEFGHAILPSPPAPLALSPVSREGKPTGTAGEFTWVVGRKSNENVSLLAYGDLRGISPGVARSVWRNAVRIHRHGAPISAIIRILVDTIRMLGQKEPSGTIAQACYSIAIMRGEGEVLSGTHFKEDLPVQRVLPQFVGPGFGVGPVMLVRDGPSEAVLDHYRSEFAKDLNAVNLTEESFGAYLKLSPEVERWASYIASLGMGVGQNGLIAKTLQLAKARGLKTVGDLDDLLRHSQGTVHAVLHEYIAFLLQTATGRMSVDRHVIALYCLCAVKTLPGDPPRALDLVRAAAPAGYLDLAEQYWA